MPPPPLPDPAALSRRRFLAATSQSLLAGYAAASLASAACTSRQAASGVAPQPPAGPLPAVTLPRIEAATEKQDAGVPHDEAPGDRVGYAIVGLGHLALEHILPGIVQCRSSRVVALVSGSPDTAATIAASYGVPASAIYSYATFDRIVDDPAIQAVYIVLPNAMHAEFAIRAARAGKHVLCEKPMATSVTECQQMIDAARAAHRLLMIAYRLQYNAFHREVIRMARSGELGTLRAIHGINGQNLGNPGQWRLHRALAGGGSLVDVGIYCINAARYITGREPLSVSATTIQPRADARFREVEDAALFRLHFPDDVIAEGSSSYSQHEFRQLVVCGSRQWVRVDNAYAYDHLRLVTGRSEGPSDRCQEILFPPKDQFAAEMDHFSRCIQQGTRPRTPGEEGMQDQRIIEAIYRSAQAGGARVDLPDLPGIDPTRGSPPDEPIGG
jgi:predicted dehydrogenase